MYYYALFEAILNREKLAQHEYHRFYIFFLFLFLFLQMAHDVKGRSNLAFCAFLWDETTCFRFTPCLLFSTRVLKKAVNLEFKSPSKAIWEVQNKGAVS